MYPQDQQPPQQPQYPQPSVPAANPYAHSNKLKLWWGIICLVGPTALLIVTLLAYALVNFLVSAATPASDATNFSGSSPVTAIINIILYLIGMVVVLTWLPGIIVGIILLATRK